MVLPGNHRANELHSRMAKIQLEKDNILARRTAARGQTYIRASFDIYVKNTWVHRRQGTLNLQPALTQKLLLCSVRIIINHIEPESLIASSKVTSQLRVLEQNVRHNA
jgi:hypothetical protein